MALALNTVSVMAVLDLRQALLEQGILEQSHLPLLGLTEEHLLSPVEPSLPLEERRLPEGEFIRLWHLAINQDRQPHIGLLVGRRFNPQFKGVLANLVSHCGTLNEALDTFRKNIAWMNPAEEWVKRSVTRPHLSSGSCIQLVFNIDASKGYPQAAVERSMSSLVHWAGLLSGQNIRPLEASFAFPKPSYSREFEPVFGANIHFDSDRHGLVFSRDVLELPILSSNPYLSRLLEERINQTRSQAQLELDLALRIKQMIRQSLPAVPSIEQVSQDLNRSRSTLYRQLQERNTHYKALVTETRKEVAQQRLGQNKSIACIAHELGFHDSSAFQKAFKRWFGLPPSKYKAKTITPDRTSSKPVSSRVDRK